MSKKPIAPKKTRVYPGEGRRLRMEISGEVIGPEGASVDTKRTYWRRRLKAKDAVTTAPKNQPPKKETEKETQKK